MNDSLEDDEDVKEISFRDKILTAIYDPGNVLNEYKGDDRTLTEWQRDAVMAVLNEYATWIVGCGSASLAPNPEFDNEADAFARYNEERSINSYLRKGYKRMASITKIITIAETVREFR